MIDAFKKRVEHRLLQQLQIHGSCLLAPCREKSETKKASRGFFKSREADPESSLCLQNSHAARWKVPLSATNRASKPSLTHGLPHLCSDRLEVWNPGSLPGSLTPKSLREDHPSIPNNPLIAESLYLVRYIEKAGSGI
ncbi:MAG: ATP-binding protein, partial [Acidobacteriota bacterium]